MCLLGGGDYLGMERREKDKIVFNFNLLVVSLRGIGGRKFVHVWDLRIRETKKLCGFKGL